MGNVSRRLTHVDASGAARMVDIGGKAVTVRTAEAEGRVAMRRETRALIEEQRVAKGDVMQVARIAGIQAAKRTSDLIPLCHPIPLDSVEVDFEFGNEATLRIRARVRATYRTGVEMEALAAAMGAALTVYDMCKSVDRSMILGPFVLVEKTGGRSGVFRRGRGDHA
ncbi:MAG: cyclic pyranopterin monophosphate synthase MoaC [Planctomycetes bacterium]|nr:cyclic pyranopterin monophosphate synthase MoaC [Planctomycetota bacterium]